MTTSVKEFLLWYQWHSHSPVLWLYQCQSPNLAFPGLKVGSKRPHSRRWRHQCTIIDFGTSDRPSSIQAGQIQTRCLIWLATSGDNSKDTWFHKDQKDVACHLLKAWVVNIVGKDHSLIYRQTWVSLHSRGLSSCFQRWTLHHYRWPNLSFPLAKGLISLFSYFEWPVTQQPHYVCPLLMGNTYENLWYLNPQSLLPWHWLDTWWIEHLYFSNKYENYWARYRSRIQF